MDESAFALLASSGDMSLRMIHVWTMLPVLRLSVDIVAMTTMGAPSSTDGPSYTMYPVGLRLVAVVVVRLVAVVLDMCLLLGCGFRYGNSITDFVCASSYHISCLIGALLLCCGAALPY